MGLVSELLAIVKDNVGLIFLAFVLWIFRHPLSGLIDRVVKLSGTYGSAALNVETSRPAEPTPTIAHTPSAPSEAPDALEDHSPSREVQQESVTDKSDSAVSVGSLFKAFDERDFDAAREIFEKLQAEEASEDTRFWREAYYRHRLYLLNGNRAEFDQLREMRQKAKNDQQRRSAITWLFWTFEQTGDHKHAVQLMRSAIGEESDASLQTPWVVHLSTALRSDGQTDEALRVLEDHLLLEQADEGRASLYTALHQLEKERGNKLEAAVAIEKALELDPGGHDKLFSAAYAASEADIELLAFQNYSTLVSVNSKHPAALNNLGVTMQRLSLIGKASALYRRAANEVDDSLAMGNLALKYIAAGFYADASALLERARVLPDPDPQVAKALSDLEQARRREDEKETEVSRTAVEHQRSIRCFGAALFDRGMASIPLEGEWSIGNDRLTVEGDTAGIAASWIERRPYQGLRAINAPPQPDDVYELSIKGTRRNGAVVLTYRKKQIQPDIGLLTRGVDSIACLGFLSAEGSEWHIFSNEKGKALRLVARRISEQAAVRQSV